MSIDLPNCTGSGVAPDMPSTAGLLSSRGSRPDAHRGGMVGSSGGKAGHAAEGLCNGSGRGWSQRLLLATNALLVLLVLALVLALLALVGRNDPYNAAAVGPSSAGRTLSLTPHFSPDPLLSPSAPVLSIPSEHSSHTIYANAVIVEGSISQTPEGNQSIADGILVVFLLFVLCFLVVCLFVVDVDSLV